jgi:hypothetical protein
MHSPAIIEFGPKVLNRPLHKLGSAAAPNKENQKSHFAQEAFDILLQALLATDEERLQLDLPIPTTLSFGLVCISSFIQIELVIPTL